MIFTQKYVADMCEAIGAMKLTESKREFAKAVMRAAIEYANAKNHMHASPEAKAAAQSSGDRNWRPIDTAPKDGTKILLAGKWKPFDILPGGENYIGLAAWSSLMSDGTSGYQWYLDFLTPIDNVNVDFTHWMPLPEPPVTSGVRKSEA